MIRLAKTYVDLSNKHRLDQIELMFIGDATYHSSYFGEYRGATAIHQMMVSCFKRFPDVYWEVPAYRVIENQGVEFDFLMTAIDAASGEHVKRQGLERIYFTSDGLIKQIAVCKPDEQTG